MESAEKKRPGDILTGALIGLARTTYSHLKTEDTDRVVTCALSVLARPDAGEEELAQQLKRVRAEKLAVAPGCATCVAKCGNTDDYDMERLWNGPDQVRSLKIRLFSGLKKTGRDALKLLKTEKGKTNISRVLWKVSIKDFLSWQRTGNRKRYCRLLLN